jgi:probable rRNA maturation factor
MPVSKKKLRAVFDVELIEDDGEWPELAELTTDIDRAAAAVAEVIGGLEPGTVSVALSSDEKVALLNERFRGQAKPTNVLSFPPGAGAASGYLGDIVLARTTVEREAHEQDVPLAHHVQHLVVHGMLHLLGYDHGIAADAERMEELEVKILSKLGVANPYTGALETGTSE